MERDPVKVLEQIRKVIPESEEQLRSELDEAFQRAKYKSPEQYQDVWFDLAAILNLTMMGDRRLLPSDPDWKCEAIRIFMDEPNEREEQVLLHGNSN